MIKRANTFGESLSVIEEDGEKFVGSVVDEFLPGIGSLQGRAMTVVSYAELVLLIMHKADRPDATFEGAFFTWQCTPGGGIEQRAVAIFFRVV